MEKLMKRCVFLTFLLMLIATPSLAFTLNTTLSVESSNVVIDSERHMILIDNLQAINGESPSVAMDISRVDYKSKLQAYGGDTFYQTSFGYNEGEQGTFKAFVFQGGTGLINQATFSEKAGVEVVSINAGETDLNGFVAHSFNPHENNLSVDHFGAAAGARGKASVVEGYISSSYTTMPGFLAFDVGVEGVIGKAGGSVLVVERNGISVPDLQVSKVDQFYSRQFNAEGLGVTFEFHFEVEK